MNVGGPAAPRRRGPARRRASARRRAPARGRRGPARRRREPALRGRRGRDPREVRRAAALQADVAVPVEVHAEALLGEVHDGLGRSCTIVREVLRLVLAALLADVAVPVEVDAEALLGFVYRGLFRRKTIGLEAPRLVRRSFRFLGRPPLVLGPPLAVVRPDADVAVAVEVHAEALLAEVQQGLFRAAGRIRLRFRLWGSGGGP